MREQIKGCILRSGSFLSSVQLSQCRQVLQGQKKERELTLSFLAWGTGSSSELGPYQIVNLDKWEQGGVVLN